MPFVLKGYAVSLSTADTSLSMADATLIASQLFLDLCSDSSFAVAKDAHHDIPLHRHGSPMWLAIADDNEPEMEDQLHHFPARLGLAPDLDLLVPYVLMRLAVVDGYVPRFADSGGYPYWRPGGVTEPIEQYPLTLKGFTEVVADRVTATALRRPSVRYVRTV